MSEEYDYKNPEHNDPNKYKIHNGTVLDHTLEALKSYKESNDPATLWSILLHDVGKPKSYVFDKDKGHTYHGHASESKSIINDIATRLHIDNKTRDIILFCAENHMKIHELLKMSNSKIAELMNNDGFEVLMKVAEADAKARGHMFDEKEWQQITNKIAELQRSSRIERQLKL